MRGFARFGLLTVTLVLLFAASAAAQSYPDGGQPPPQVLGQQFFRGGPDVGGPGSGGPGLGAVDVLASTGFAVLLAVLLACVLILVGLALRAAHNRIGTRNEA
jgi:hypothetical protein